MGDILSVASDVIGVVTIGVGMLMVAIFVGTTMMRKIKVVDKR